MSTPESRPLLVWMEVLDRIESALGQVLARIPEPAPPASSPKKEDEPPAAWQPLDRSLGALDACLERIQREAAEVDAWLEKECQGLEGWLKALAGVQQGGARL